MDTRQNRFPSGEPVVRGFRIPNLCAARPVLFLCLISVLLAILLVLYESGLRTFDWVAAGDAASLILWNMLLSAAALCALRGSIARWPLAAGAATAYAVVLLVCLLLHVAQAWLLSPLIFGAARTIDPAVLGRDLLIAGIIAGAALRYFHLQGELLERERAELDARIGALQARIRPHFLFNSMNIIASLIAAHPEQAERAVEDLSELFRASLREGENTVALASELELCERYLRLESWRLGERLRIERRIDPGAVNGARVPPLCLQPLLENAVYHGIQPRPDGGALEIGVSAAGDRLRIEVGNPLAEAEGVRGSGIAQANIRARLAAIYGPDAALTVRAAEGRYTAVLDLPRALE